MVRKVKVEGFNALAEQLKPFTTAENDARIFILFSGGKDSDGVSWCPDCVKAEPVVIKEMEKLRDDDLFIYCSVGDKPTWKDPNNEFRKFPAYKLTAIPTLIQWGTSKRLVEKECSKADLVKLILEDD